MAVGGLIVAVLALLVAAGTFWLQRRANAAQEASDSTLREMLAIECRRADREEAEERADAERQAVEEGNALVATLHVRSPQLNTSHEPRSIIVENLGPHPAVLTSIAAQASAVRSKPDLPTGVELEVSEAREFTLIGLADGVAMVDLEWTDGRPDPQRASVEVELPPRPPWLGGTRRTR